MSCPLHVGEVLDVLQRDVGFLRVRIANATQAVIGNPSPDETARSTLVGCTPNSAALARWPASCRYARGQGANESSDKRIAVCASASVACHDYSTAEIREHSK